MFAGGEAVFDDFGKAVQDLLDRGRINVHAADDHHVVGAADDAAFEKHEAARAHLWARWAARYRRCDSG